MPVELRYVERERAAGNGMVRVERALQYRNVTLKPLTENPSGDDNDIQDETGWIYVPIVKIEAANGK